MSQAGLTRAAVLVACVGLGILPGSAAAAPITVQVVNQRGVEQVSRVSDPAGSRYTDGHGKVVLDVVPGAQIAASRGATTPEGAAGVTYTVPDPVPAGPVQLTLPALPDAVTPEHDATEAWLLARVNDERAALGRAALAQSGPLNRASDAYARHLLATGQFSHTALFEPGVRALDQGWPIPGGGGTGEVLALAPSKETALGAWKGSSGHWTLLMGPDANVTGVARAGNRWVMTPSTCGPTDAPERCEVGQSGARSAPPPPATPSGDAAVGRTDKRARLRVRLRRRGHKLFVRVRLVEGRGVVRLSVRRGRRRAPLRLRRKPALLRATTVLPGKGRWKVSVRFKGAPGWADQRLAPRWVRVG